MSTYYNQILNYWIKEIKRYVYYFLCLTKTENSIAQNIKILSETTFSMKQKYKTNDLFKI